jgi:hypothetical protein
MSDRALERTRPILREMAGAAGLLEADVSVLARPLTPEEAIGTPGRRDFPILIGKERVIEARVGNGRGHAFTDTPREFLGRLSEVIDITFRDSGDRVTYVATLNATLAHLGQVEGAVHCRDDDPERCGAEIAATIRDRISDRGVVGLIGFNPAIAEHLAGTFGPGRLRIADLNPDNVGREKFGVAVWDGAARTGELLETADLVLLTGTTLVNGTFDSIWEGIEQRRKMGLVYGVTAAGVCALLGFERICPYGR